MVHRKRGRLESFANVTPQSSTQVVNNRGFPALADEIYLEIISHIPAVPIPTRPESSSYPEIRRSRHETLLSLSQTSRSLRRFFWRYLWQRIEVREGMKVVGENDTLKVPYIARKQTLREYSVELVRQLEIVTIRNPQLAQYVNYVDVFIGDDSIDKVLAELARCLSLFPNLHTIQIDVILHSKRRLGKLFQRIFKKYSYPQIRNVFVMFLSKSLVGSCPEARHVGSSTDWMMPEPESLLHIMVENCPRLEVLEDFAATLVCEDSNTCKLVVNSFPNLRHITICPLTVIKHNSPIDILTKLNQLQTITLIWQPTSISIEPHFYSRTREERYEHLDQAKEGWINRAKQILITIQLRDKLEKFLMVLAQASEVSGEATETIALKPEDSNEILTLWQPH